MFFYALWWSFCMELDALRTVSHRPQRVNPLPTKRPPGAIWRQTIFLVTWTSFAWSLELFGPNVFPHPLLELFVEPGAIRTANFEAGGTPAEAHRAPTRSSIKGRRKTLPTLVPREGQPSVKG
jgi:hypothetical protein